MMAKKWMKRVGILVCAVILSVSAWQQVKAETYTDISNPYEWEVLKLVNKERLKDGADALSMFQTLQSAADVRAKEIATSFSHTRPNGTTCFTILSQKGISYYTAGENIASGQRTPEEVMDSWMNSEGHKSNILNANYDHVGVGYGTTGFCGNSWVQVFCGGCTVSDIQVNKTTQTYPAGTSIDSMNRYLIVSCSHGTAYVPVISSMCNGYQSGQNGTQNVTVKFQGKTVKMPVTIGDAAKSGIETSDSDTSALQEVKKPGRVVSLTGKKINNTSYKLTWKKMKCDGYEVWRADSENKKYKKIKTITTYTKNTFRYNLSKMKTNRKYYYKVRAYNKDGKNKKYGPFSAVKTYRKKA